MRRRGKPRLYGSLTLLKICIIGCGAVGSLFAAHLAQKGEAEVWAYDVWKDHVEAIHTHGLRISGAADFTAKLNATSDPQELPRCDYGIVATKAIHTRGAIAQDCAGCPRLRSE